ncbi:MAG: MAPEG family protein [Gammaproteobacteria bacterium]
MAPRRAGIRQGGDMELVAVVAGLALLELVYFGLQTGRARGRYKIEAPAVTGHPIFERHFRVQQNSIEQIVVFLPALFLFATYVHAPTAAALGAVYVIGRLVYERGYVADPAKRGPGFGLSFIPSVILVLGGLAGAVRAWL